VTAPQGPTGPLPAGDRIEILDVLRGFALFGVLLVNVQYFVEPSYNVLFIGGEDTLGDRLGFRLVEMFGLSKFYPIFSFLFGYGLALQIASTAARGTRIVPFFAWRLTILLVIGLFHGTFLWDGDILTTYALLGFLLLLFRGRSERTLLATGFACLLAVGIALASARVLIDTGAFAQDTAAAVERFFARTASSEQHVVRQTLRVMAMFLFGLAAGRRGLLDDPVHLAPQLPRLRRICLGVGLAGNAAYVALHEGLDPAVLSSEWVASVLLLALCGPLLGAGYVTVLLTLDAHPAWHRRLGFLRAIGRTALTNYLLQSLIMLAIVAALPFRIRPLLGVALTFLVFAAQVVASDLWLRRFRFGPVEWVWRSLTYGERQPFRV
jgi:uncharacterized protein